MRAHRSQRNNIYYKYVSKHETVLVRIKGKILNLMRVWL